MAGSGWTTSLIGTGKAVPQALTGGFRLAYLVGVGLSVAAAVVTFAFVPRSAPAERRATARLRTAVGLAVLAAGFVAIELATAGSHGAPIGAYTTKGAYSFVSAPALHPPKLRTDASAPLDALSPGYVFVTSFYDLSQPPMVGQSGPLILDCRAQPVWFRPVPENVVAANLSRQTYRGKPTLAWWQGAITSTGQTLSGEDIVVDQHYDTVARLKGADGWAITLHALVPYSRRPTSVTGPAWSHGSACRAPRPWAPPARGTAEPPCTRAGTAPPEWRQGGVLAGPSAGPLSTLTTMARSGFETAVPVPQGVKAFKLEALDASGRRIGASRLFGVNG